MICKICSKRKTKGKAPLILFPSNCGFLGWVVNCDEKLLRDNQRGSVQWPRRVSTAPNLYRIVRAWRQFAGCWRDWSRWLWWRMQSVKWKCQGLVNRKVTIFNEQKQYEWCYGILEYPPLFGAIYSISVLCFCYVRFIESDSINTNFLLLYTKLIHIFYV